MIKQYGDIIEIKDVIPKDYQKNIVDEVTGLTFPWYFNPTLVSNESNLKDKADTNISGFNHFLYEENKKVSPFFDTIYPLVLSITSKVDISFNKVERMRFNLTMQNKHATDPWHMPHIDTWWPHYNAIYYVNDCDGDTVIFNESDPEYKRDLSIIERNEFTVQHRVTPEKGKIVIFPGHYYHASSFTKNSKFRCVLNINLGNLFV